MKHFDEEMSEQIDFQKINQFILCKQHLTEDSKEKSERVVKVTKDICGLHAQVAITPYLSLWNRVENFRKEVLEKELYEKRTLVKIWCMRRTLHIVSTEQVMEYYQATKRVGRRKPFRLETIHKRLLNILDEKGPLTAQELNNHILELKFDPYVMGYKNRQRVISPEYEKKVFWSTRGEIAPSILVNGYIIGIWSHKEEKNKIKVIISFFEKNDGIILDRIKEQAERLAKFISEKDSEIIIEQP